jgi:acyl-CoA synthetase (AMP-forming)/AMP-acid ligase II
MAMLLPTSVEFLRLQGRRRGSAAGLHFHDRFVPWGELADTVDALGTWLARRGVGAGDPVGVLAANEPAMVAVTFAVWEIGAVVVPLAVRSTPDELAALLAHVRARALLADEARAAVAREAAATVGVAAYVCRPGPPLSPRRLRGSLPARRRRPRAPGAEHLAAVTYTSGTTGRPKGVTLTHANLLWAALACGQARGDGPDGVGVCLSPLTHVPVFVSHFLCRVLAGATAVLLERFDVAAVLDAVERHGVTDLPLIGGMVFDVVAEGGVPERVRRSVRRVSVGGAPTRMEHKRELARIFPGAEVIEAYGQTESTDGVTMARGTSALDRPGTVGRPNPYVVVDVRRPDGRRAEPGEEGEIVVAGPTVMRGYHRDRRATAAALRGGWLHTGDLGQRDADGYLFWTGRVKDLIITGGENVSPTEVEEVLRAHPGVADVAVIGTPHPRWGEQVTAVVVRRTGVTVDGPTLEAFAGTRLAGHKRPRRIEFVATLPRNAANKVETALLRERFA